MRQSQLFTKTRKTAPADEVSENAKLLIRAGYIHKEMAGVYSFLPLGLRVLNKINNIIREEMNKIGGQEVLLSSLQDKNVWETTDRWDDKKVDVWFKTKLQNKNELGLGFTHEEAITRLMRDHISSYKDLPKYAYQIQTKFRNEVRAKSGIMRTREFPMKDLYSFCENQEDLDVFYEKASKAYLKIFERVGIGNLTYKTFASGGVFSKYSHEFQTISDAGEDIIYVDEKKKIAINKEVYSEKTMQDLGLNKNELKEKKSIEVGNIFKLGTRFSEPLKLFFKDKNGEKKPVVMGSYGIGPSRVMGTVVEVLSDEKGIIWPKEISPFTAHIIRLGDSEQVVSTADALYERFAKKGMETLYDDRNIRPGEKFADSELLGIPTRIVISENTIKENQHEVSNRATLEKKMQTEEELFEELS